MIDERVLRHIAIFQYEWPLQIHTLNLAAAFASKGCRVDLFLKGCSADLVDLGRLEKYPSIRIVNFDVTTKTGKLAGGFRRLQKAALNRLARRISYTPIIFPTVLAALPYVRRDKSELFIGVEKKGMIWASFLSRLTGTPFVYYSLELYDEQHPFFVDVVGFSALRRLEKKSHRKASATIIQDRLRKEHLFRSNGITNNRAVLLPVSIPGRSNGREHDLPRAKWGILEVPIVLYLGLIEKSRHCLELADVARHNSHSFKIVFHGYGEPTFLQRIRDTGGEGVILSTELVSEDLLPDIVASADIGLATYGTECANEVLTAFASEKVALYCRAGIPFVAFDTPSYRELVQGSPCCILIEKIADLPRAVEVIMKDYSAYKANALNAFQKYYKFERNVAQVITQLNDVVSGQVF